MKYLRYVCLIAFGWALLNALDVAVLRARAQALQRGISVELVATQHATSMPAADDSNAWVVTVDNTGRLYLGTDPMTPGELQEWMIEHPRRREQNLYIKADARAPYASVEKALDAARAVEFSEPVLLVMQQESAVKPGVLVSPKGLEVTIDGRNQNRDTQAVVVKISGSAQKPTSVTINHEAVSWDLLEDRLRKSVEHENAKSVFVEADAPTTFAQVARVIDACSAAKAKAVLSQATL